MFVSFEGVDGAGKTTQRELFAAWLRERGREVVTCREPGGTPLGERIRELLLDGPEMTAWAEAALFAAARAELVERVIRPARDRGADVVCDRYVDSSLAYQGVARGLGLDRVLELNAIATGGVLPERTFLLVVDVEDAARRGDGTRDRIEREGREFRAAVEEGYRAVAARFSDRVVVVDAAQPPDAVAAVIREAVADLA